MDRTLAGRQVPGFHVPHLLPRLGGAGLGVRVGVSGAWNSGRRRFLLIALAITLPVLGGGWLWLRSSPFVAVRKVQISGVHGPEAAAIDAALSEAAHRMSTLQVSTGELRASVAQFPVVRDVRAVPRFPHGLRIIVTEQLPVAVISANGLRAAVAADGVVLGPTLISSSLPTLPATSVPPPGMRVHGWTLGASLAILGAAPAPLLHYVSGVTYAAKGLDVAMRDGLSVYFGTPARPHAKWLALAAVLADPSSAGASYVDVRLPSRPAAGFPGGVVPAGQAPAGSAEASAPSSSSTESTIASLAAGLSAGSGVSATAPAAPAGASPSGSASSTPSSGAAAGEAEAGASSGATGTGSGSGESSAASSGEAAPSG
jgi:cell division septal protein FtsQ